MIHQRCQRVDPGLDQILQEQPDHVEGQPEDQSHDEDEHRQSGILSREELIHTAALHRSLVLPGFHHRPLTESLDEGEPHVGHGGGPVHPPFLFHLDNDMLQHFLFVVVQFQFLQDQLIPFHQLGRGKPRRDAGALGVVGDEIHDAVNAPVQRSSVLVLSAEVQILRTLLVPRHVDRVVHQFLHALISGGRDGHHRNAEDRFHVIDADAASVVAHFIHHVQCHHHGHVQFDELKGQIHVPLDIGGVHDIDDPAGVLVQDELPCHQFLFGIGRHGVDARQIRDVRVGHAADHSVLPVHGDAGEIAHVLIGTGELIEQGGLAAVLISRQRKGQHLPFRKGIRRFRIVVFAALAQTGVLDLVVSAVGEFILNDRHLRILMPHIPGIGIHEDLLRIRQTQGQFIPVHVQLHGISQRRELFQSDQRSRNEAHIQKMLAKGALSSDLRKHRRLSDGQFAKFHKVLLPVRRNCSVRTFFNRFIVVLL